MKGNYLWKKGVKIALLENSKLKNKSIKIHLRFMLKINTKKKLMNKNNLLIMMKTIAAQAVSESMRFHGVFSNSFGIVSKKTIQKIKKWRLNNNKNI